MSVKKQKTDFENAYVVEAETFRDSVGTMDNTGNRKWVFPRKPKGRYTNYRNLVGNVLLIIFFVLPFIKINGNPLLKFNILDREFFIFGQPFYPQDFFILTIGVITGLIFITLFTVVFGRIFCGWICPQTIFMEGVFRKIEYMIEGDRNKQIRLDSQPWTTEKIWKRALKWTLFILISLVVSHLMFSYIVGYERVVQIVKEGPIKNYDNFLVMILFTAAFYFVFAWFREQVCTLVCPYGRLQGVLIDKQTINVFYDFKRGENRSKWRKNEDRKAAGKGDCIDCGQCVVVCPTGIDIRNGQQLECINCTACIDACDDVMDKIGLPRGLVRYASEDEIEKGEKFRITLRMKAYAMVLLLLVVGSLSLLLNRSDVEGKFIKPAGTTYYLKDNRIVNSYNYTLLNKSNEDKIVTIKVISPEKGEIEIIGAMNKIIMKRDASTKGTMNISFPTEEINFSKQNIVIGVYDLKGELIDSYKTFFEGPFKMAL
ncbi:cytochrome c oxidase accessory protein CcoG [Elizabethkingia argentiflava]|uniref:Cytochrome c oxidase accessory protein CcoG n=1 Tax=Elizabethkingia argenteiflava TaxID=2681556 RepID=A0A845PZI9_9FLAO|nr:cytochrome c oxidase accessory protein CcoG [Elizabethkingia argenteiflava]NAW52226.1 cytochrome c oxidase accessory protein CcoG [Elizabethkingia argenteiflava]